LYYWNKLVEDGGVKINEGDKVLFWHTGGSLGMYEKVSQLQPLLPSNQISKMKVAPPIK
jgi:hypothetical protein